MSEARLRVEFHCHTIYSLDSLTRVDRLLAACERKGIDRVVITDHNTIAGALKAKALDPQRVIVGEEVLTQEGEILAAYVQEEVPRRLPPLEAVQRLRQQGAFISLAHPFDALRFHWSQETLLQILPLIDAIEVFNARSFLPRFNRRAREFAQQYGLPGTVGSDAHGLVELGRATAFLPPFDDADGLRAAIRVAENQVAYSAPWMRLISRYATLRKKLRRG